MYSETFFAVLIYASMIGLIFVYAFQVAVFVKDRRDLQRERREIRDVRGNIRGAGRESSSPHHKENTNGSN